MPHFNLCVGKEISHPLSIAVSILFKCIFSSSSIKISQTRIVQINSSLLTIDNMKQLALVTMAVIIEEAGLPAWQVYTAKVEIETRSLYI